ncbi:DinB superfamily protein [Lentzea fradiae]|uniref:DinB superfamily protein n=1 Tax=Lentzea fradiae TaxID=200378 RepID=A0A1G8CU47_9PSEU|nr:DinB family protein [Lentzea fradiae]SDH48968.1 DinB superfamily protein [Lentzea fradiae]
MDIPNVALRVADVHRSKDFYTRWVDFTASPRGELSADVLEILDKDGDPMLLAGPAAEDVTAHLAERHAVFAPGESSFVFRVDDVEQRAKAMREGGLDQATVTTTRWGDKVLAVPDEDGYTLKFLQEAVLDDQQVLDLFASGPDELERALDGVTERELEITDSGGVWTSRAIVHHICDGDLQWLGAIMAALVQPGYLYNHNWYTTDRRCADQLSYDTRPVDGALRLFRSLREHLAELLTGVPGALDREVRFNPPHDPEGSPLAVREVLRRRAIHTLQHIDEVRELRDPA